MIGPLGEGGDDLDTRGRGGRYHAGDADLSSTRVELLPRFPGRPLHPGDTWADTVISRRRTSAGLDVPVPISGTGEATTVYTYSLVGDTLVDGRTLRKITVSGVVAEQPTHRRRAANRSLRT